LLVTGEKPRQDIDRDGVSWCQWKLENSSLLWNDYCVSVEDDPDP
jgi:hypothetical protein